MCAGCILPDIGSCGQQFDLYWEAEDSSDFWSAVTSLHFTASAPLCVYCAELVISRCPSSISRKSPDMFKYLGITFGSI